MGGRGGVRRARDTRLSAGRRSARGRGPRGLARDGLPPPGHCADVAALRAAAPLLDDPVVAARILALFDRLAGARAAISTRKLAASDELLRGAGEVERPPLMAGLIVAPADRMARFDEALRVGGKHGRRRRWLGRRWPSSGRSSPV